MSQEVGVSGEPATTPVIPDRYNCRTWRMVPKKSIY